MKKVLMILVSLMPVMFASASMAEGAAAYAEVPAIDLTPIFQAVLGILAALITHKLIPWIQGQRCQWPCMPLSSSTAQGPGKKNCCT